ncbi:hypothetical protein PsorP6_015572 [Peronosclerospora sorghi]|uniref:Uncharacterized protein n=1 Tax=Peronosclerospora sorghi TaxID=230839 RepID=A0ACC0WQS1_9STRA|nr:hypothetical protein PsorP6_015572 [Peronosclerospora sorghi]
MEVRLPPAVRKWRNLAFKNGDVAVDGFEDINRPGVVHYGVTMPQGGATKRGHSTKTSVVSDNFRSGAGPALPARLRELEKLLLTEGILAEMDEMNKADYSDEYQRNISFDYYSNVT